MPRSRSASIPARSSLMASHEVKVPDIGNYSGIPVIEVLVQPGDTVRKDQGLITLESDKATMEVPSSVAGVVKELKVKLGDEVAEGTVVAIIEAEAAATAPKAAAAERTAAPAQAEPAAAPKATIDTSRPNRLSELETAALVPDLDTANPATQTPPIAFGVDTVMPAKVPHASPAVRQFARELGVDLFKVGGSERNGRITREDVQLNKENEKAGIKLTMLAFLMKAVVAALKQFPDFNASLDASGENLIVKKYFHIGFAADTPNGLVVPVIRNADTKGVIEIARETGELAKKARDGKLGPADMSGGCFSISSLGGIGGTAFTPIVNAPEVAILGVSRSSMQPVWNGKKFKPRLILPLSLSYDHRVIDGASAARFTAYLGQVLADMRRVLL
ncbi:MAG: 2-oxo acid dehydrogenase subunit E2 [Xanthomonadales bacterium]|nr:2-oxo acid dehydrogenase subunit E2 [Xanthomonadales bacterium]